MHCFLILSFLVELQTQQVEKMHYFYFWLVYVQLFNFLWIIKNRIHFEKQEYTRNLLVTRLG